MISAEHPDAHFAQEKPLSVRAEIQPQRIGGRETQVELQGPCFAHTASLASFSGLSSKPVSTRFPPKGPAGPVALNIAVIESGARRLARREPGG